MLKSYQLFSKNNCKVAALEICSTWEGVVEKLLNGNIDIPFYQGHDPGELEVLIAAHLNCA